LAKVASETAEIVLHEKVHIGHQDRVVDTYTKVIAHTGQGSFFDTDNAVFLVIKRRDDSPQAKRDEACGDQQ